MANGILERLRGDLTAYRPVPFWSWNDRLEPEQLRRQIAQMKEVGIGGFFMHARGGLETEYMGDEWFDCVAACVDEAKKRHMRAWAYDENGWPSGFAGMKLLQNPANHAHYLECEQKDAFDPQAMACYRVEDGKLTRVTDDDGAACLCVYDRTNGDVVDILNWQIVRAFIAETHEKYYKRLGKDFGSALLGFFTDEPQYFRNSTGYSPVLAARFKSKYNEDITDLLGALFVDCEQAPRFRYRYWLMMNELYTEAFAGQIFRWCEEHNCMLTGHTIDETSLFGQMMCCAGVMPFYEYEHIPGIDWLGRKTSSEVTPRQVSSVAMQLGKKQVITETYAGCSWDATPKELKRIAQWQYVNGVNLMCHHLYPYSMRGQRKRDYPGFFGAQMTWTKDFKHFNDYFTRLGYMLAESREIADTLVIHPVHSAYLVFDRHDRSTLKKLSDDFVALVEKLGAAGIAHHYADETLLKKYGRVKGKKIQLGQCAYSQVVVPDMECMDESTLNLLAEFASAGGRLFFAGAEKPCLVDGEPRDIQLESSIGFDDLANPGFSIFPKDTAIRFTLRRAEFGDFVYAVNLSDEESQKAVFRIHAKGARKFDPEKPGFAPIYFEKTENGIDVPLELEPDEAVIFFLSAVAESAEKEQPKPARLLPAPEAFIERMDANTLTVDRACLSYDGENYTEPLPVMAISDRLLREKTNRTVYIKYLFTVLARPNEIRLEAEPQKGSLLTVNGTPLSGGMPGEIDASFVSYDIAPYIRTGENEAVMRLDYYQPEHVYKVFSSAYVERDGICESMVNCLSYESDIENIYLRGDFCVSARPFLAGPRNALSTDGGFAITLPRRFVSLGSLHEDGFPFFGGSMRVHFTVNAAGTEKYLRLQGRFATAKVQINGGDETLLMFSDRLNVEGRLRKGENEICVTLTSGLRNTMGYFHIAGDPEPVFTHPGQEALYGTWQDGKSEGYDPRYQFVFFGVSGIELS